MTEQNPHPLFTDAFWVWEYRDVTDEQLIAQCNRALEPDMDWDTATPHNLWNTASVALEARGYMCVNGNKWVKQ